MDSLTGTFGEARARDAFVLRCVMVPPWCLRIEDDAPLTVVIVVRGGAVLSPDHGPSVSLTEGDVVLVRGPGHYEMADDPSSAVEVVVGPGQVCTSVGGAPMAERWLLGVRTWGNAAAASAGTLDGQAAVLLVGTYERRSEVGARLLDALPHVAVLRGDALASPLVGVLAAEVVRDEAGQEVVLDRLLDVVVIDALRAWFSRPDADVPAWYRADRDPVVGAALRLLHAHPERDWTVASLAAEVGASRAAFARRFRELVGEPPLTYLTRWRLTLAADLLRDPSATVGSVARRVGYGSPFALSAAFKRVRGVSPREHRELAS